MLFKAKDLIGKTVHASDGDIGEIRSLYFEGDRWKVRYLAAEVGGWFNSKQVLIPSSAVPAQDFAKDAIDVNMTRDQIRSSPDAVYSLGMPRFIESEIGRFYDLPGASAQRSIGPGGEEILRMPHERRMVSIAGNRVTLTDEASNTTIIAERIPVAADLHSAKEIRGFRLQGTDGRLGDVDDFIIDDASWAIRYLAVDTPGRAVLISPDFVNSISERDSEVRTDLSKDSLRNAPEYDPKRPIEADYERRLQEHFGREAAAAPFALWRFSYMRHTMPTGKKLRIEVQAPARVRWTTDEWRTYHETETKESVADMHIAELDTQNAGPGSSVHFTFFWVLAGHWEGKNFSVRVREPARERQLELAGV